MSNIRLLAKPTRWLLSLVVAYIILRWLYWNTGIDRVILRVILFAILCYCVAKPFRLIVDFRNWKSKADAHNSAEYDRLRQLGFDANKGEYIDDGFITWLRFRDREEYERIQKKRTIKQNVTDDPHIVEEVMDETVVKTHER